MKTLTALALALCLGTPAFADRQSDARYIAEQTFTPAVLGGAIAAMRPVLISAISNDFKNKGIIVSDEERFFDIFIEEFQDDYLRLMHEKVVPVYLEAFSDEELADIAAFYATASGQALIAKTPELMQTGAQIGGSVGQQAGQLAMARVMERLKDENIEIRKAN